MKLSNKRYESIKKDVVDVLIRANIKVFPYDVFDLCEKLGYECIPYSSFGVDKAKKMSLINRDGFRVQLNGQWKIFYNDSQIQKRIRFTIIHEVAHIVRDHQEACKLAETEANWFAAYALSPPIIVDMYSIKSVDELSSSFNLTTSCAQNAMHRYNCWKNIKCELQDYEIDLIKQFNRKE